MRSLFTAQPNETLAPSDRIHNSFRIPDVAKQREGLWWDWADTATAVRGRPDMLRGCSFTTGWQAATSTNLIGLDRCVC